MYRSLALIVAALSLSACASQTITVNPPESHKVTRNEKFHADFDHTWNTLVKNLSGSFFVINNIEKQSRIINVSFSTDDPRQFIDCGVATLTVNKDVYHVAYSDDARYPYVYQQGAYKLIGSTQRQTSLSGRVNIYMEPVSKEETQVSVNAKYVMDVHIQRYTKQGVLYQNTNDNITFQSDTPTSKQGVTCESRGTLEKQILAMASP